MVDFLYGFEILRIVSYTLFGLAVLMVSVWIYSNYDQKDMWYIDITPNKQLYEKILLEINELLDKKGYDFSSRRPNNVLPKDDQHYVWDFDIDLHHNPYLKIRLYLTEAKGRYSSAYFQRLEMSNIREENLYHAQGLSRNLHIMLEDMDYENWKDGSEVVN